MNTTHHTVNTTHHTVNTSHHSVNTTHHTVSTTRHTVAPTLCEDCYELHIWSATGRVLELMPTRCNDGASMDAVGMCVVFRLFAVRFCSTSASRLSFWDVDVGKFIHGCGNGAGVMMYRCLCYIVYCGDSPLVNVYLMCRLVICALFL